MEDYGAKSDFSVSVELAFSRKSSSRIDVRIAFFGLHENVICLASIAGFTTTSLSISSGQAISYRDYLLQNKRLQA